MKNVKIQSDVTIQVTSGLQHVDLTVKDSDIKDRIKVKAEWRRCLIIKGRGIYPKEIAEWPTVKSLEKAGKLTVGTETDEPVTSIVQGIDKPHISNAKAKVETEKPKVKVVKDLTLDEVAGE